MNATTDQEPDSSDQPTPASPADPRPPSEDNETAGASATAPPPPVRWLRRATDSPLGGVATGLANYFGINPIAAQVAFVVSIAFSGFGALAYIACWLLIPSPSDPETRPVTITSSTPRAVVGVLFAIGAASSSLTLGPNTLEITLLPLILVAAGFYLLNQRDQSGRPSTVPSAPGQYGPSPGSPNEPTREQHWANVAPTPPPVDAEPPGPPVTSVTLAVAAVVIGLLVTINQFGAAIPAPAILGAALAVLGGGLVYGAFYGRPKGLVPIGLLLVSGFVFAPAIEAFSSGGTGNREFSPVSEADVLAEYDLGAGPLELDLRRVEFTEDRTIDVVVGAGYAEIWIPNNVNVVVDAETSAGYVEVFGNESAGVFADDSASLRVGDAPTITLDIQVSFGYVEVHRG